MKLKFFKPLFAVLLICTISMFTVSCGDDDDVDCGKLENQVGNLEEDYWSAFMEGECDDMEEIFDNLTGKYNQAKNCKSFKEALDAMEMTFDEFMDEREADHNADVEDCNAPA